jgi:hypothetical protein
MEAGGVEPPSEKRYDTKPTCLAGSVCDQALAGPPPVRLPRSERARNAAG